MAFLKDRVAMSTVTSLVTQTDFNKEKKDFLNGCKFDLSKFRYVIKKIRNQVT